MTDAEAIERMRLVMGEYEWPPAVLADVVFENTGRKEMWFMASAGVVDLKTNGKVVFRQLRHKEQPR